MQNYDKSHDYPSPFQIKCGYINRFGTSQWELVRFAIREYGIAAPNGSSGRGLKEAFLPSIQTAQYWRKRCSMVRWEMKHAATADEARCNGTCTALDFLMEKYCARETGDFCAIRAAGGEAGCADVGMRTKGMRGGDACM